MKGKKNMRENYVLLVLKNVGAIITGHFRYTSGLHGPVYVNKDAIYPHTEKTSELCASIANSFQGDMVDVVIAPAVGGVILSQWVAWHLTMRTRPTGQEILGVYADKEGGDFVIRRGYDRLVAEKNVLVVEDILTTGGSVKKVVQAVRAIGGNAVGVGVICNRGNVTTADIGDVPKLVALLDMELEAWNETDCPLCRQGVPINTAVGKGRAFLAARKQT